MHLLHPELAKNADFQEGPHSKATESETLGAAVLEV